MVMSNLPLTIFPHVNERISSKYLVSSCSHRKFVNTYILAPVVTHFYMTLYNLSFGLFLQEMYKVVLDKFVVSTRNITDSRKQYGFLRITLGNSIRIFSGKSTVPQLEKILYLFLSSFFRFVYFRHDRRMMLRNLPLTTLKYVDISVTALYLGTSSTHRELVDTSILGPVCTNNDISVKNLTLRLELEEVCEVINDSRIVGTRNVTDSGKKNSLLGITISNLLRVFSSKSIVPKSEQGSNLILGDGFCDDNAFGHDTRVMMGNLPFSILIYVNERVSALHLLP
mmetsp:Transcript_21512/g.27721  ORF Transcript_21512/g.27721 Transcript_21512/m.27721 type:complete len:283 (-) Transcript_21512:892-1740(-)